MSITKEKRVVKTILLTCALVLLVIMLGAFTRLVDAGLGCPDWPGCYGHFSWPTSDIDIATANIAYPDTPVEVGKSWPEMVHRYFASSLGFFAILIFFMIYSMKKNGQLAPLKHAVLLLALVVVQGVFGMWTVTLKLWPQIVTVHLLGGFLILSTLWLLLLRLRQRPWQVTAMQARQYKSLRVLALVGLLVVLVQVGLGGWTTSNYAAVACPDLPTCQGQWWPPLNFSEAFNITQEVGPNYLGGVLDNTARVTIHLMHRLGAIITAIVLALLIFRLWRIEKVFGRGYGCWLLLLLVGQIILGLSNIYFHFPVFVAVLHNAIAAILLATMAGLNYQLHQAREGVSI